MAKFSLRETLEDIASDDEQCRKAAVDKLEKLPLGYFEDHPPQKRIVAPFVPQLARLLVASNSSQLRDWSAQMLGEAGIPDPQAVDALTRGLGDKERNVVRTCVWVLGAFEAKATPAVKRLLRHLGNPWLEIRWRVCWALGRIGARSPATAKKLAAAFTDAERLVRGYAVLAFGKTAAPTRAAFARLEEMKNDPDLFVTNQANMAITALRRAQSA
jgi:HEAT repeat protein